MPREHLRVFVPLAYMFALFSLSSIPGDISSDNLVEKAFQWVTPNWQNLLHVPVYAGLATCWLWALRAYPLQSHTYLASAFVLTLLWAIADETYQLSVPGRYGSLTDLALNALGAFLAVMYARRVATRLS